MREGVGDGFCGAGDLADHGKHVDACGVAVALRRILGRESEGGRE